jgi:benzoylformate decarboxylase
MATATVRDVTYDLLRAYGLTTIFGNLGSTEEPFLAHYPSDFRYVLGLQEASVLAMADGFAQATRGPALVNLHTGGCGCGRGGGGRLDRRGGRAPPRPLPASERRCTAAGSRRRTTRDVDRRAA